MKPLESRFRYIIYTGGGARIGEVDAACAPHHFIVPVGRAHTTGCAGQMVYTGAHGYNERMHGLGIDYMTSATVVISRNGGEIVTCSEEIEPELFWAVRGGGPHTCIICEMTVSFSRTQIRFTWLSSYFSDFTFQFNPIEAPNRGQYAAGQRVYLPTGMLGMPTRQRVMDKVIEAFDLSSPSEYGASFTMLGTVKQQRDMHFLASINNIKQVVGPKRCLVFLLNFGLEISLKMDRNSSRNINLMPARQLQRHTASTTTGVEFNVGRTDQKAKVASLKSCCKGRLVITGTVGCRGGARLLLFQRNHA